MSYESWRYRVEEGGDAFALADEAATQAPSRASWACAAGCAHCCFLRVAVTAAEADRLVPFVTPAIAARIEANAGAAEGLAPRAHRMACAFLSDGGRCLAYHARPLRCRAHVSRDVGVCEEVRAGALPGGAVPGDPWLATVVAALQAGLGGEAVELHAALRDRLTAS